MTSVKALSKFVADNILKRGWSGVAKVLCILRHWGVQLILVYGWARLAILVASKGRGECFFYFFCFFPFIPVPLSFLSLSFIFSTIYSISFLPFSGRCHKMTHEGWRVVNPQHDQNILKLILLFFSENKMMTFHVNHLLGRSFIWNVKSYFLWKKKVFVKHYAPQLYTCQYKMPKLKRGITLIKIIWCSFFKIYQVINASTMFPGPSSNGYRDIMLTKFHYITRGI